MTRPYPVSVAIRKGLHLYITCGAAPDGAHSGQCDALHNEILQLMHRYGLPPGPPIVHPKDHLTRS